jgi:hypothetical protein
MDRVVERVAGLDVHRDTVVACVRVPGQGGRAGVIGRLKGTHPQAERQPERGPP